jgi:3-deoxy-D-manno-octulosonic-acid transferase
MIYLYQILGFILIPYIKFNVLRRIKNGKEIKTRYKERFGITKQSIKPTKKVIWIHAASLGEFKSADCLINSLHEKYSLLITTTTVSAANYASKHYNNKIIHQFAPLDITFWVKKFLDFWKPSLIIWIESDLWPTTLNIIKRRKIKAILVNLRISPKSFNKWKIYPSFYSQSIECFSEIFAQSREDQNRIKLLTKRNIKFIGNLKLVMPNTLKKITQHNFNLDPNTITIMFSSTHNNEEAQLMPIIKSLLRDFDNLRVIIAPRHPERAEIIMSLCTKSQLLSNFESEKNPTNNSIMIINSFDILSNYFTKSDIVFIGGSLISAGGHNPIEPATHNCAIITGPKIFNWQNIFDDMIGCKACLKIQTIHELKIQVINLLNNKKKIEVLKNNAYNFAQKQFVDTNVLKRIINNHMNL